jgi:hypothetical protein
LNIGKLVRDDRTLLPPLPRRATVVQEAERATRAEFLLRRARAALALPAHASWRGLGADDVKDANKDDLRGIVAGEVARAATKVATLQATMKDGTKTFLISIADLDIDPPRAAVGKPARFRETYATLQIGTSQQLRDNAIVTAAWSTLADDLSVSDADLHSLVSRRLLIIERMLWYVGGVGGGARSWSITSANEWKDGWKRIFEYPRLAVAKPFSDMCKAPPGSEECDALGAMVGWVKPSGAPFHHDFQINATAHSFWEQQPAHKYAFFFKKGSEHPVIAVVDLLEPEDDFRNRNLLMCDQVIHSLHLEALVRVKSKIEGVGWFKTLIDGESDGWLRIDAPNQSGVPRFLVGDDETRFFERKKIDVADLQVGDHVIVFNHPAYDKAKGSVDAWRLENAVVVTTQPRVLLQGHGTNPLPLTSSRPSPVKGEGREDSMRLNMLTRFNRKLNEFRAAVVAENKKTLPRTVIDDFDSDGELVQRTDTGPYSGYDQGQFRGDVRPLARWWLRWTQDYETGEPVIAADADWARWVWETQKVELTNGLGYFPLWEPSLDKAKSPIRDSEGLIKRIHPVYVSQQMAPGWTWYYEKNESASDTAVHHVHARRPKVI